ncbi:MAG: c-type cytochrome [Parvularculaceae bacterium]
MTKFAISIVALSIIAAAGCGSKEGGASTSAKVDTVEQVAEKSPEEKGGVYFRQRCAVCHSVTAPGAPGHVATVGPTLFGVYGAHTAHEEGFGYSPAMRAADFTWNDETLDAWIKNPQLVVAGNRMAFAGEPNAEKRADLIAYLKTLK